jgi:biotin--protein ligase
MFYRLILMVFMMANYLQSAERNTVYIYAELDDEEHDFGGVSKTGVARLMESLGTLCPHLTLKPIRAAEVIAGAWLPDAKAFIMPGGRDLPYGARLNGKGNEIIKHFVETGGTYIGFCAGAYYGAAYCDFHRGDARGYEVLGARELAFFPGAAKGPVLAEYYYGSEKGARIAQLKKPDSPTLYNVYFNGGCAFESPEAFASVETLAYYANEGHADKAAIVRCQVGTGKAVLSGVHPEYSAEAFEKMRAKADGESLAMLDEMLIPGLADRTHVAMLTLIKAAAAL